MTVSTGEASLIADLASRTGVDLPDVPPAARDQLLADLPTLGYIGNPLDPWGATDPPAAYAAAFRAFAGVGRLRRARPRPRLPVPLAAVGGRDGPRGHRAAPRRDGRSPGPPAGLRLAHLRRADAGDRRRPARGRRRPVLRGTVEAFGAIAAVARWEAAHDGRLATRPGPRRLARPRRGSAAVRRTTSRLRRPIRRARHPRRCRSGRALPASPAAGLPVATPTAAATPDAAADAAARIGFPVVLKIDAIGLGHKSDIGGVRLGLAGRRPRCELPPRSSWPSAPRRGNAAAGSSSTASTPASSSSSAAGATPSFGPVVLVGLGGILAEALDDVAVRLAPVDEATAAAHARRAPRPADPRRGPGPARHRPRRRSSPRSCRSARLLAGDPSLVEVDLNPVLSGPDGTVAVDALVVEVAG